MTFFFSRIDEVCHELMDTQAQTLHPEQEPT